MLSTISCHMTIKYDLIKERTITISRHNGQQKDVVQMWILPPTRSRMTATVL